LVYLKMGQFDAAIRDYDAALRLNPNIAESLYGRGIAKFKKGDRAAGTSDIEAARAINPQIAGLMATYGIKASP
jgi:tetratricopeptide (TPR) repeat protein